MEHGADIKGEAGTSKRGFDLVRMWTYFVHMKTATLRDLRNDFAKLEAWLGEGEEIRIEKRGKPIAMLTPMKPKPLGKVEMPDFSARLQETWGDRVFSEAEIREMKEAELEGDEG
jgi:antitoxin (DNA-binding transcriptional repressor) of toxin-antitoxin stability system